MNTMQVDLIAPMAPGEYSGTWRMRDASGRAFGDPLVVRIIVALPATSTPVPPTQPPPPPAPTAPPASPEPIIEFWVDKDTIKAGECATLMWRVYNVESVYLEGAGVLGSNRQFGLDVVTRKVCPSATKTYTLSVRLHDGLTQNRQVKVTVK